MRNHSDYLSGSLTTLLTMVKWNHIQAILIKVYVCVLVCVCVSLCPCVNVSLSTCRGH